MIKIYIKLLIVLVLVVSLNIDVLAGGGRRNGTAGATELTIPVGARGIAMSGSYLSGIDGIEAIFYNPAGVGSSSTSAEAMFSQMNYIADIGVSYAAVAAHFGDFGALAFSVKSIDFGDIAETTVENPQGTGSYFSPTFVVVGVTYANALTDRIRVGVNVNLISEKIMRTGATGFAFDAGVQYNGLVGIDGLKLGVALKNLGPQMKYSGPDLLRKAEDPNSVRGNQYYAIDAATFELPSQLELGVAYERRFGNDYKALLTSTFQANNFQNDEFKFGAELSFKNLLFLRGGYSLSEVTNDEVQNLYGPTFGAGVNISAGVDIQFDYAYRWVRYFDPNHVFTLKLGF